MSELAARVGGMFLRRLPRRAIPLSSTNFSTHTNSLLTLTEEFDFSFVPAGETDLVDSQRNASDAEHVVFFILLSVVSSR